MTGREHQRRRRLRLLLTCASCPLPALVLVVPLVVPSEPAPPPSADTVLVTLAVKGRAPKTGSAGAVRSRGGEHLKMRANTRDDVRTAIDDKQWRSGTPRACVVVAGRVVDPYTGRALVFAKADASAVQIDHVVSLSDAWQKGAAGWSFSRRRAFANDRLNLLAVDGPTNSPEGRRRHRDVAPAAEVLPVPLRGPPGGGEGTVATLGHAGRARRNRARTVRAVRTRERRDPAGAHSPDRDDDGTQPRVP